MIAAGDDPWGFDEAAGRDLGRHPAAAGPRPRSLLAAVPAARAMSASTARASRSSTSRSWPPVGYMGFTKSYLISITNIFSVRRLEPADLQVQPGLVPVRRLHAGVDVLWGRFYCGRVCAFGALTQLMDAVAAAALARRGAEARSSGAPAGSSSGCSPASSRYYLVTSNTMVYRYVEPFWMFGLSETSPCCGSASACCCWPRCSCATCTAGSSARSARRSA